MPIKDQLQRTIHLKKIPKRIVSLVPSQTELLIDLGLEDAIVGITKFCIHPKRLRKEKSVVGGTKQVHLNKIKALQPDIILCNKEENTLDMVEALETIAPVHISDIYTIQDCLDLIAMYGSLFNCQTKASGIIDRIRNEKEEFSKLIFNEEHPKIAYFIWKNPYMVAASNTFIDVMIKVAGFKNVFHESNRYPEVNLDNERLLNADIIFLSSEPFPFKQIHVKALQDVFNDKKVVIVDGEMFSWYGSRLIKSFQYFKTLRERLSL